MLSAFQEAISKLCYSVLLNLKPNTPVINFLKTDSLLDENILELHKVPAYPENDKEEKADRCILAFFLLFMGHHMHLSNAVIWGEKMTSPGEEI